MGWGPTQIDEIVCFWCFSYGCVGWGPTQIDELMCFLVLLTCLSGMVAHQNPIPVDYGGPPKPHPRRFLTIEVKPILIQDGITPPSRYFSYYNFNSGRNYSTLFLMGLLLLRPRRWFGGNITPPIFYGQKITPHPGRNYSTLFFMGVCTPYVPLVLLRHQQLQFGAANCEVESSGTHTSLGVSPSVPLVLLRHQQLQFAPANCEVEWSGAYQSLCRCGLWAHQIIVYMCDA